MKNLHLEKVGHNIKSGDKCATIGPNVTEDTIFYDESGEAVGFFMRQIPQKMQNLVNIANQELLSERVPKQEMSRGPQGSKKDKAKRAREGVNLVTQHSTILGAVPPKPHMRRNYPTISSVHRHKSARVFIKAMLLTAIESEKLICEKTPQIYERQKNIFDQTVPKKWRFGNLFTSSISNFNIAAQYHRDTANLKGCVNVIITKRENAHGGNLTIPDYGATIDSCDNSILVYPAWRNLHGVTPIQATKKNGYRNSLVFYPLKAFCVDGKEQ